MVYNLAPCEIQQIEAIHDWTKAIDREHKVEIIILDLSEVFDHVPYYSTHTKLNYCEIQVF